MKDKPPKKIRRFTRDVLPRELQASIREMARIVTQDVARKVLANDETRGRLRDHLSNKG